jgi:hypothetical protein
MKYCESKEEVEENTDLGVVQIEQKRRLKFIWEKRGKREEKEKGTDGKYFGTIW